MTCSPRVACSRRSGRCPRDRSVKDRGEAGQWRLLRLCSFEQARKQILRWVSDGSELSFVCNVTREARERQARPVRNARFHT